MDSHVGDSNIFTDFNKISLRSAFSLLWWMIVSVISRSLLSLLVATLSHVTVEQRKRKSKACNTRCDRSDVCTGMSILCTGDYWTSRRSWNCSININILISKPIPTLVWISSVFGWTRPPLVQTDSSQKHGTVGVQLALLTPKQISMCHVPT